MAETQPAGVFRFGPFEVDLRNRRFFKNGVPLSLRGQPFEILALLLEHPGQLVTREQLRARLWPSGTVVEFDHSIHTAVTKLREVLGENAEYPSFIATEPRHGYRFIASVSTLAPRALEAATADPPASSASETAAAPDPHMSANSVPASPGRLATGASLRAVQPRAWRLGPPIIAALALVAVASGYVVFDKLRISRDTATVQPVTSVAQHASDASATVADFNPPPHSIAVLPFVNLSGEKEQEYFSDGLTEELLSALARINDLQVVAQTSSFYFKGKDVDLGTIARKLNVGAVLEGSVRRSGHRVRITAQLIDAKTGYHLWSQTYDRSLRDTLAVQTEIARAVTSTLSVTFLADVAAKLEAGGTRNPSAFDAYLRGLKAYTGTHSAQDLKGAIAGFTEAIRQDPNYALAYASRAQSLRLYTEWFATGRALREGFDEVQSDALQAIALAPDLAAGHLALAAFLEAGTPEFARATEEYERALALAPNYAYALRLYADFAVCIGRTEAGLAAGRHAVLLDPLNPLSHVQFGWALYHARRYEEAIRAFRDAVALDPDMPDGGVGLSYYLLGDYQSALVSCEGKPDVWLDSQQCLAITYRKLGRYSDADSALAQVTPSATSISQRDYAEVYAQWGDIPKALEQLETSLRLRAELSCVRVDPLLDPLRQEPRYRAVERALRFPD